MPCDHNYEMTVDIGALYQEYLLFHNSIIITGNNKKPHNMTVALPQDAFEVSMLYHT